MRTEPAVAATRPRATVAELTPYALGEYGISGVEQIVQLGQNELPFAPAPSVVQALAGATELLPRYPDPTHAALRDALARTHGLDPERIVCGAGSTELMLLLAMAYLDPGDQVVCSRYGYRYFQTLAAIASAEVTLAPERGLIADVDAILEAVTPGTKIVFLVNPNNPTGSRVETRAICRLRKELREDVLLVLDAAYGEFVLEPDYDPGSDLVDQGANVVMLRTFSKSTDSPRCGLGGPTPRRRSSRRFGEYAHPIRFRPPRSWPPRRPSRTDCTSSGFGLASSPRASTSGATPVSSGSRPIPATRTSCSCAFQAGARRRRR